MACGWGTPRAILAEASRECQHRGGSPFSIPAGAWPCPGDHHEGDRAPEAHGGHGDRQALRGQPEPLRDAALRRGRSPPARARPPVTVRVHRLDDAAANDMGVAEEVAIKGKDAKAWNKRPDLVLYVNGIALGVGGAEEIHRGRGRGHPPDAGQPAAGVHPALLHDGADHLRRQRQRGAALCRRSRRRSPIGWPGRKRARSLTRLDRDVTQMLAPARFLETDPRLHPVRRRHQEDRPPEPVFRREGRAGALCARTEGGIIWQTQGSGKSLIMVMLARWIRENAARRAHSDGDRPQGAGRPDRGRVRQHRRQGPPRASPART